MRGLILSAADLRGLTDWPEALVEDYLNILENIITIANLLDIEIDQKIEEIATDFINGSIPFAESNLLVEDVNLNWDNVNDVLSALKILTDKISFNLTAGLTPGEGELTWNDDDGALNIGMPGGNVIAQIPLEALARVVNKSGSTIANGKLVYVSGSQGNRDTIKLSDNTDIDTVFILGMATEDISNNSNGYVARFGYVRGSAAEPINTIGTVEGDPVYLSTLGGFTVTHPTSAINAVVVIGTVNRVHATEGVISLQPPKSFTIGNDFNGTIRQSVINKSTGVNAASGFTAVNDNGYFTTIGIAGSGNVTFPNNVSVHYAPGYGDHWQAVDGNKDFVWFTDPTDSHNNSSLSNEIMRLVAAGHLKLVKDNSKMMFGAGDDFSIYYDGTDANIKTDEVAASDLLLTCGTAKTLELQTVVWDDLRTPINSSVKVAGKQPTETVYRGGIVYSFSKITDNQIAFNVQLPHTYKLGSDIEFHIHYAIPTSGVGGGAENIKWDFTHAWADIGDAIPAETTVNTTLDMQNQSANTHYLGEIIGTIDGSGISGVSSMIICGLTRDVSVADNYDDVVYILELDFHYQINTIGSRQEAVK